MSFKPINNSKDVVEYIYIREKVEEISETGEVIRLVYDRVLKDSKKEDLHFNDGKDNPRIQLL